MIDTEGLWDGIYGNEALKRMFMSDIASGRLSHSYIIEGERGSGKLTLARVIAAAMSDSENDVRKILASQSPDVFEVGVGSGKKSIGIDSVREIKATSYIKPNDLEYKVYIVENAELMTVQAQNALLKLFEEPPKDVYIFLLTDNASSLLPTVRSRAPTVRMQSFSNTELACYMRENCQAAASLYASDRESFDAVIMSSKSIGQAEEALKNGNDGSDGVTAAEIFDALCERNRVKLLALIGKLPNDREAFGKRILNMRLALRDIAAGKCADETDMLSSEGEHLARLSSKMPLDDIFRANDILEEIEHDISGNANISTTKSKLFIGLTAQK